MRLNDYAVARPADALLQKLAEHLGLLRSGFPASEPQPGIGGSHARFRLLVCSRRAKRIVGSVSVGEIDRAKRTATLGYWIGAKHARRGYMTEALGALLRDVLPREGLETIHAYVLPENVASKRVLEKLGFRREGTAPQYRTLRGEPRDHERWVLRARS